MAAFVASLMMSFIGECLFSHLKNPVMMYLLMFSHKYLQISFDKKFFLRQIMNSNMDRLWIGDIISK